MVRDSEVDALIQKARTAWGFDDRWQIDWGWTDRDDDREFSSPTATDYSGVQLEYLTEKKVFVLIDRRMQNRLDRLTIDVYHELGHAVIAPVWKFVGDWIDQLVSDPIMRRIFEAGVNSSENEVIDWLVCQVLLRN